MRRILAPVVILTLTAGLLAVAAPAALADEGVPVWAADFMAGTTNPFQETML